jgi:hypothetical protein
MRQILEKAPKDRAPTPSRGRGDDFARSAEFPAIYVADVIHLFFLAFV